MTQPKNQHGFIYSSQVAVVHLWSKVQTASDACGLCSRHAQGAIPIRKEVMMGGQENGVFVEQAGGAIVENVILSSESW